MRKAILVGGFVLTVMPAAMAQQNLENLLNQVDNSFPATGRTGTAGQFNSSGARYGNQFPAAPLRAAPAQQPLAKGGLLGGLMGSSSGQAAQTAAPPAQNPFSFQNLLRTFLTGDSSGTSAHAGADNTAAANASGDLQVALDQAAQAEDAASRARYGDMRASAADEAQNHANAARAAADRATAAAGHSLAASDTAARARAAADRAQAAADRARYNASLGQ